MSAFRPPFRMKKPATGLTRYAQISELASRHAPGMVGGLRSSSEPARRLPDGESELDRMEVRVLNLSLLVVNGRVLVMDNDNASPVLDQLQDLTMATPLELQCAI
jgi:hypothetical protein